MKRAAVVPALVAVALVSAGCGDDDATERPPETTPAAAERPVMEGAEPFDEADVEFAAGMLQHHEQAVEMAELAVTRAGSEPVRDLAGRIAANQGPEIEQLRAWLADWGAVELDDGTTGGMVHGTDDHDEPGMMGRDDMAALADAQGASFDELFLTMMIQHHEGAVDMARVELSDGQHPGATEMARAVVETQEAEIAEMRALLDGQR